MYFEHHRYTKECFKLSYTTSSFITKDGYDTMKYLHSRILINNKISSLEQDPCYTKYNYNVSLVNNWCLKPIKKIFIMEKE